MTRLQISLAQMDVRLGDPEANFARAEALIALAAGQGSRLILFPELWSTGYALDRASELAAPLDSGAFARFAGLARIAGIAVAGSMLERDEDRIYNTFVLYDAQGRLHAVYRKLHLFRLMDEDRWLASGSALAAFDAPWGPTGAAICYDLRFPELFRAYALRGCRLVLLPAEWPASRLEHWRILLRARAIENQVFIIATNRVGTSRGEEFGGFSAVIDPTGRLMLEGGAEEALLTAQIDLTRVQAARKALPILTERRPDVYG